MDLATIHKFVNSDDCTEMKLSYDSSQANTRRATAVKALVWFCFQQELQDKYIARLERMNDSLLGNKDTSTQELA